MKPKPTKGDTRRVVVLQTDAGAAVDRWTKRGWKVTRQLKVNNIAMPTITFTMTYVGHPDAK